MKRIITQIAFCTLCLSPVIAEDYPVDKMMRDMGYTDTFLTVQTANAIKRSNAEAKAYYSTKKLDSKPFKFNIQPYKQSSGFTKDEILQPRINEASESPDIIPALLRYHKENPKSDKITRKLAVTTYSLGQYKESLYWFTLTYQRNRSDLESLWNMASIADSIGEKNQARVYLREYAKVDPHSAWGRMAKEILNSGYSTNNMSETFDDEIAKVIDSSNGVSDNNSNRKSVENSNSKTDDGIIVVSGDKYDLESFVASYKNKSNFKEAPKDLGDTSKGKSQIKPLETPKVGTKTSLESAKLSVNKSTSQKTVKPAAKEVQEKSKVTSNYKPSIDDLSIKAVADPL